MKRTVAIVLILMLLLGLAGCGGGKKVASVTNTKATAYLVAADGTETVQSYTVTTLTVYVGGDVLQELKTYAPDGTLLSTKTGNEDFVYTDDYAEYEDTLNMLTAYSLVGSADSANLDYTSTKNEGGATIEELFVDKTGKLPTVKIVYTFE